MCHLPRHRLGGQRAEPQLPFSSRVSSFRASLGAACSPLVLPSLALLALILAAAVIEYTFAGWGAMLPPSTGAHLAPAVPAVPR